MPQNRGHELGECALIHSFGMCAAKALPLHSGGAFAPLHHDEERACSSTMPNRAPVGCAPGPSRPGPGLRRALPLRDLPRQGFRAPTPTACLPKPRRRQASVSPLEPDGRFAASARRPG